jgi:uncharacterized membrane protein
MLPHYFATFPRPQLSTSLLLNISTIFFNHLLMSPQLYPYHYHVDLFVMCSCRLLYPKHGYIYCTYIHKRKKTIPLTLMALILYVFSVRTSGLMKPIDISVTMNSLFILCCWWLLYKNGYVYTTHIYIKTETKEYYHTDATNPICCLCQSIFIVLLWL